MLVKGKRVLKNGVTAGYVRQKDGSWKWRFLSGPKKIRKRGGDYFTKEQQQLLKQNKHFRNKLPIVHRRGIWGKPSQYSNPDLNQLLNKLAKYYYERKLEKHGVKKKNIISCLSFLEEIYHDLERIVEKKDPKLGFPFKTNEKAKILVSNIIKKIKVAYQSKIENPNPVSRYLSGQTHEQWASQFCHKHIKGIFDSVDRLNERYEKMMNEWIYEQNNQRYKPTLIHEIKNWSMEEVN